MSKDIIKLALAIGLLFLLVGCDDPNMGKSAKRIAQERLLNELANCDSKFGTETSARGMNQDYCIQVLEKVDKLVREGYFEDSDEAKTIISTRQEEYNTTSPEEIKQAEEELDDIYSEIVGDI